MTGELLKRASGGGRLGEQDLASLAEAAPLDELVLAAASSRDLGFGDVVTYSRKVFLPLTQLCRDSCHYCTFAHPPRPGESPLLSPDDVLAIARAGRDAGCKEALFTLGEKPERRYKVMREALARLGHRTILDYLHETARLVLRETGLLPHLNPGTMTLADINQLRPVAVSMGLMLESTSERLCHRGGPHFGSPDKRPAVRLATIEAAGQAAVPFTSGILLGIGETRRERIAALLALRNLHERFGHIQEIIIQNFRAKPGTLMANSPEPSQAELLWTVSMARIVFGPAMAIQAPPNLTDGALGPLIGAGLNDWGGISPVTIDHVNPERPWPQLVRLAEQSAAAGKVLTERLAAYPSHLADLPRWLDPALRAPALVLMDSERLGRMGNWAPGAATALDGLPARVALTPTITRTALRQTIGRAQQGETLTEPEIVALFGVRGDDYWMVCEAADALRRSVRGDLVTYVVTRNINYTNICSYRCQFCAFSKGKLSENLRGRPYTLALDDIAARVRQAWDRGATEVCLQGGIHPAYTGQHYLDVVHAVKDAAPAIHVHAFSPLEIWQGAATLGRSVRGFLRDLQSAGLGSLPGTAAEILDDDIRAVICPDKIKTGEWLDIVRTAHEIGLRTTSTIMYGHMEQPIHWARHLRHLRSLQAQTGGITEFVPLPFVPMQTPIFLKGHARAGATLREAVLMHAVARLALHPHIPNIQTSWVKMGHDGAALCLQAGANDFGGTLMDESISRAAGASHGQETTPAQMEAIISALGRTPHQRTTLYGDATPHAQRRVDKRSAIHHQAHRVADGAALIRPTNSGHP